MNLKILIVKYIIVIILNYINDNDICILTTGIHYHEIMHKS